MNKLKFVYKIVMASFFMAVGGVSAAVLLKPSFEWIYYIPDLQSSATKPAVRNKKLVHSYGGPGNSSCNHADSSGASVGNCTLITMHS